MKSYFPLWPQLAIAVGLVLLVGIVREPSAILRLDAWAMIGEFMLGVFVVAVLEEGWRWIRRD